MATKPSLPVITWATATNYNQGPDTGQPTKVSMAQTVDGHYGGSAFAPTAQEENWFRNAQQEWQGYFEDITDELQDQSIQDHPQSVNGRYWNQTLATGVPVPFDTQFDSKGAFVNNSYDDFSYSTVGGTFTVLRGGIYHMDVQMTFDTGSNLDIDTVIPITLNGVVTANMETRSKRIANGTGTGVTVARGGFTRYLNPADVIAVTPQAQTNGWQTTAFEFENRYVFRRVTLMTGGDPGPA